MASTAIAEAAKDFDSLIYWDTSFWFNHCIISNITAAMQRVQPLPIIEPHKFQERPKIQRIISNALNKANSNQHIDSFLHKRITKHLGE